MILLLLLFVLASSVPIEWKQVISPNGNLIWIKEHLFEHIVFSETKFNIITPNEGDSIMPDTMTYITWNTYSRKNAVTPTDVKIKLYTVPSFQYDIDPIEVSVLAHSVPNTETFLWIARVPRAWSSDDWYLLCICSLEDDNECSYSSPFRILNPYAFYP